VLERAGLALQELARRAEDRPLAVRVELTGACPIHKKLTAKKEQLINEIRALANETGDAWVEKVILRTAPPEAFDDAHLLDGPLGELEQLFAEINADHERLMGMGEALADLKRKLPPELKEGPDAFDLDDPDHVRGLLEQARHILVSRLVPAGGDA
jgi:hypothetical protein